MLRLRAWEFCASGYLACGAEATARSNDGSCGSEAKL